MINATRYRHPLVNGYSGFAPPDFDARAQALRAFPADVALEMMHKLGVTHVVVHRTGALEERRAEIDASPALRLVAEEGDIAIYRFVSH
jgi:sugar phosphate isomerase/epimerase